MNVMEAAPSNQFNEHYDNNYFAVNPFEKMVFDAFGLSHPSINEQIVKQPNANAQRFYNMLSAASEPL